ncbi:aspartate/glutamate racemase family protein [Peribacillus frigoritolerans]|uniref:aspartate/glutamate racemase family protein n=1 Tax=Peribacillus frigoritolerans TaxID=450367 RepID=UPI0039A397FC
MRKINFINPFGTDAYDGLIRQTLSPYADSNTELVISHLKDSPQNIDFYSYKHLAEQEIMDLIVESEKQGFNAVIVGCCYDPGVRTARELVDIPVIGPLEASLQMASYFGHSTSVVTDHYKAVPYLKDMVRTYGYDFQCLDISCINWWVTDMIKNPLETAKDAFDAVKSEIQNKNVESVILGCTIISACLEYAILKGKTEYLEYPILNPNTMALKMAESLADLHKLGRYNLNRSGYYAKPINHNEEEFKGVRNKFSKKVEI